MFRSIDDLIKIAQCPRTWTPLSRSGDEIVSAAGERYPIVAGKPVLVREIRDFHLRPPSSQVISKNIAEFVSPQGLQDDAVILHHGSGDVPSSDRRVISMDILPTSAADIVAEAEHLPFRTCTIDYVVSGAVFEHVYDPVRSAAEVRRVLKELGGFYIDTAFMQTYHGFPGHFFNMTHQAAETYLVDDFILEHSLVPQSGTILYTISNILNRFIEGLTPADGEKFSAMTIGEVLADIARNPTHSNPLARDIPEFISRSSAACALVVGRKPKGYDPTLNQDPQSMSMRRDYYAARVYVMQMHHECQYYARRIANPPAIPTLSDMLSSGQVSDPTDSANFKIGIGRLREASSELETLRESLVYTYCNPPA